MGKGGGERKRYELKRSQVDKRSSKSTGGRKITLKLFERFQPEMQVRHSVPGKRDTKKANMKHKKRPEGRGGTADAGWRQEDQFY